LIIDVFGNPTDEEINSIPKEKSRKFMKSLPKKQPKSFEALFSQANPLGKTISKKSPHLPISFGSFEKTHGFRSSKKNYSRRSS